MSDEGAALDRAHVDKQHEGQTGHLAARNSNVRPVAARDVLHHETYDQTHAVPTSHYVKALCYLAERLPHQPRLE